MPYYCQLNNYISYTLFYNTYKVPVNFSNGKPSIIHMLVVIFTLAMFIIGLTITDTFVTIAQESLNSSKTKFPNSTDAKLISDDKHLVLTWLKINGTDVTESEKIPVFIVDKDDFWKTFDQLYKTYR
jgi:hypothetical protein